MKKLLLYISFLFIANITFAQVKVGANGNIIATGIYPVANSSDVKGGVHYFQTLSQRNALPTNFRDTGMLAYVGDSAKFFYLNNGIANSNWTVWSGSGGSGGSGIDSTSTSIRGDTTFLNLYKGGVLLYSYYWQGDGTGGGGGGSYHLPYLGDSTKYLGSDTVYHSLPNYPQSFTWSVLDSVNNVASPNQGDTYLVSTSPTGSFSGEANNIAIYDTTAGWGFSIPTIGNLLYNTHDYLVSLWNGTAWVVQARPLVQNWWSRVAWNGAAGQFIQTGATNSYATMYGGFNGTNTGLGQQVFTDNPANTGHSGNTAVGAASQLHNSGDRNTSVGQYSLWYNTVGHDQVAIGYQAAGTGNKIYSISLGTNAPNNNNTFSISDSTTHFHQKLDSASGTPPNVIGKDFAGNWHVYQTPSGGGSTPSLDAVTAVGSSSSRDITVNGLTIGLGGGAQFGNSAIGANSLSLNTSGYINTAVGYGTLSHNTTGSSNLANGSNALFSNTTGNNNTGLGSNSLYYNATGNQNTGVGNSSLNINTSGYDNTGVGNSSLASNTTGYYNTANGSNSLTSNTTGAYNSAMGYNSMNQNTTGRYNTAIGDSANYSGNYSNTTSLGSKAIPTQSNQVVLGDSTVIQVLTYGKLKSNAYGTGVVTGTPAYNIVTDASGNFIETALGGGGGSTVWDDSISSVSPKFLKNVTIGTHVDDGHTLRVNGTASFNLGGDATGDIFYRDSLGTFTRLGIGTSRQRLSVIGGIPAWVDTVAIPTNYVDSLQRTGGSLNVQARKNGIWTTQYIDSVGSGGGGGGGAADSAYFWQQTGNTPAYGTFLGTTNNRSFRIRSNNIERMVIDSMGLIGIGTTNPTKTVEVYLNSTTVSPEVRITNASPTVNKYAGFTLLNNNATSYAAVSIYQDVSGSLNDVLGYSRQNAVAYESNSTVTSFDNTNAAGIMVFGTNNTERLKITAGGNIGVGTTNPIAILNTTGFATGYKAVSSTYTATSTDYTINCTGTFTVTLPTSVGIAGRILVIKNYGTGAITVGTTSSQTIDGSTTYSLPTQYKYVTLTSNGGNWLVTGNN